MTRWILLIACAVTALGQVPDFTGVWAGPGFTHKVGPNDTDSPTVTRFDRKKMSPFKAGGLEFMARPITGKQIQDDPTSLCLPNGLSRQILSPYPQQFVQAPGQDRKSTRLNSSHT